MTWRSQNGRFRTKSGEQKPAANGTLSVAEPGTAIQSLSLEHELGKIQEVQDRSPLANLPSPARLRRGTWGGEHPENFAASLAQGVDDETISAKMSYREKLRANGEQALQRTRNRGAVSPKSAPVLPDNTFDLTPKGSAQMTPHGAGSPFLTNFGMIAGQTQASPHMVSWHESAAPFWQAPHIIETSSPPTLLPQPHDVLPQTPTGLGQGSDLLLIAMQQALDAGYDREQIAAQLRAAAPCYYED